MSSSAAAIRPAEGDERLISAIRWRPGAARRSAIGRGAGVCQAASMSGPGPAATSARMSARRRAAISSTTLVRAVRLRAGRSATVMPVPARSWRRRRPPPRLRPPRPSAGPRGAPSSSSVARPASMVSAARSMPSSICSTAPPTSSAAAALSSTTSRRAPGSPRRTASVIRAFSSGVPPDKRAVAARLNPSAAASMTWRSMTSPATM